ncbi:MAG TPA: tetratricopeptide repeat protein [Oculatellaceae cyanobacterium]
MRSRFFTLGVIFLSAAVASPLLSNFIAPCAEAKKAKGASTAEPADENFNQGVSRFKNRDFDGAVDSFLQATYFARNGYNPEAYFWLGKSYMAKHEDVKALEAFKKHVEQNMSKSPQAHIYMAEILMRNNRDQEANDEAKNALKDSEGLCPEAHNIMGQLCIKNNAFMDGEWQFLTALGEHPWKYTEAWMNMAEGRLKAKNYIGAYDLLQKLLEAKGRLDHVDLPKIYYDMGLCKLARGDHQGSMEHFHQCLEIDPNFYQSHLELAIMFESEKHYSSAIKEYGDFVQTAPADNPKVSLAKERIQMLEQKIAPVAPSPTVAPSPYMRQQQQVQMQMKQQNQPSKDSGF